MERDMKRNIIYAIFTLILAFTMINFLNLDKAKITELDLYNLSEEDKNNPVLKEVLSEIDKNLRESKDNDKVAISKENSLYKYSSTTLFGKEIVSYSYPIVRLKVEDVGSAGSSGVSTTLKIIYATSIDGKIQENKDNPITFEDIFFDLESGENSTFTSTFEQYKDLEKGKVNVQKFGISSSISTIDSDLKANQKEIAIAYWNFSVKSFSKCLKRDIELSKEYLVNVR